MENITNAKTERELSDFGLVSALVSLGFEILRTSREGSRVYFIFAESGELDKAVRQYMLGDLRVNARLYFEATKHLKNLIYGGNQHGN